MAERVNLGVVVWHGAGFEMDQLVRRASAAPELTDIQRRSPCSRAAPASARPFVRPAAQAARRPSCDLITPNAAATHLRPPLGTIEMRSLQNVEAVF